MATTITTHTEESDFVCMVLSRPSQWAKLNTLVRNITILNVIYCSISLSPNLYKAIDHTLAEKITQNSYHAQTWIKDDGIKVYILWYCLLQGPVWCGNAGRFWGWHLQRSTCTCVQSFNNKPDIVHMYMTADPLPHGNILRRGHLLGWVGTNMRWYFEGGGILRIYGTCLQMNYSKQKHLKHACIEVEIHWWLWNVSSGSILDIQFYWSIFFIVSV